MKKYTSFFRRIKETGNKSAIDKKEKTDIIKGNFITTMKKMQ